MKPKLKRVALLFLRFVFASYYIGEGGGEGGGGAVGYTTRQRHLFCV